MNGQEANGPGGEKSEGEWSWGRTVLRLTSLRANGRGGKKSVGEWSLGRTVLGVKSLGANGFGANGSAGEVWGRMVLGANKPGDEQAWERMVPWANGPGVNSRVGEKSGGEWSWGRTAWG